MLVFKGGNIKSLVLVRTFFLSPRAISGVSWDLPNRTVAVGLSTICCNKNLAGFETSQGFSDRSNETKTPHGFTCLNHRGAL